MELRLIIFDFDGTLGDTRRNIVTTMQMTIAELGLPCRSDAECISTIGLPLYGCFETLYPDTGKEIIRKCADTYRRVFQENLRTIKPKTFPKVIETLSMLKGQGLTLAIASSRSHASLVELTQELGISDIISFLIGADDVEKAKPNPEPVQNILAALGYEANEALVVGDMNVDILMGVNAGTKTCGVTYGNGTKRELEEAGADYIINSFEELIEIVCQLRYRLSSRKEEVRKETETRF
jgi:phosphoglycolate phosphatase